LSKEQSGGFLKAHHNSDNNGKVTKTSYSSMQWLYEKHMVSCQEVWVLAPARILALCSWAREMIHTAPLATQECKFVSSEWLVNEPAKVLKGKR